MKKVLACAIVMATVFVAGWPRPVDAGIFGRLFGRGGQNWSQSNASRQSAPAVEQGRRYSYEPGTTTSERRVSSGSSSRTPAYLLPKTDSRKYSP